ncbi:MAG: hypothetical protein Q9195_004362 [Heterodermia aff. obscurata]
MRARGSISAPQPSPISNDDDVLNEEPGRDDEDDDTYDGSSECDYTGSAQLQEPRGHTAITLTRQEATVAREPGISAQSITHFQQPLTPLEIPQGTGSLCDVNWTGATGQSQTYQELPTPFNDNLSGYDPFEESTPIFAGSQPSWWTNSPMDEHYFHNVDPSDVGFLDLSGSSDNPNGKEHPDSNDGSATWENEKKGSITLTLSQVDSDVAQEIMRSVLKHSARLKIRCIVNDE